MILTTTKNYKFITNYLQIYKKFHELVNGITCKIAMLNSIVRRNYIELRNFCN